MVSFLRLPDKSSSVRCLCKVFQCHHLKSFLLEDKASIQSVIKWTHPKEGPHRNVDFSKDTLFFYRTALSLVSLLELIFHRDNYLP